MPRPDPQPRPIEPFGRKPITIKTLPEWIETDNPAQINVSIFDRAGLFFHQAMQYSRITWWLLRIVVAILKLIKTIEDHRPKENES